VGRNEVCRMEFLWVRWFGAEPGYTHGFRRAKLPKIGFVPSSDEYAFGFLDPQHVICSCYLIPAFSCEQTTKLTRAVSDMDNHNQRVTIGQIIMRTCEYR
jgi:hypothetical protein